MVNPFEKTPAEKEEDVKDMLQRGYSFSQIMKECHVSPSTISNIKKKLFGSQCEDNSKNVIQKSKETQALKLFNQGMALLDVAIELDIPTHSIIELYQNFQRLRNMDSFVSMYEQVQGNIVPFLHLFDLMNGLGMTPEQVAQQVEYGIKLPSLGKMRSELSGQVQSLNSQKQKLGIQMSFMQNQLEQCKTAFDFYDTQCQMKRNEIMALDNEIGIKKVFIERFDNDEGYIRIKEAAKEQIKLFAENNQALSAVTLSATLEAVRRYPDSQKLFLDIITSQNSNPSYQDSWMELHTPQLLRLMQQVQKEMAERIAGIIVRTLNSIPT